MILHHLPAAARFHTQIDWLDSWHSFSFGPHHDPARMGFRALRVINEDRIAPGAGFPRHGHRDMEILTYVLEGALAHKDSSGGAGTIRPGDAQRMTAGKGIEHSEYNASADAPVHLLQIWLLPERAALTPGYEQTALPTATPAQGGLALIAGPAGGDDAVTLHQDARIWRALLTKGAPIAVDLAPAATPGSRSHAAPHTSPDNISPKATASPSATSTASTSPAKANSSSSISPDPKPHQSANSASASVTLAAAFHASTSPASARPSTGREHRKP